MHVEPHWVSLCCGLAATECRAMTGRFPPVARMGGKRSYADGVLDILGTWPKRWLLIDADLAIVEFWQAAFAGLLPAVAEVIRNAPADGEELWRLWTSEPVPADPVERVARWIVGQKGNFSAKPLSYGSDGWSGVAGWTAQEPGSNYPERCRREPVAEKVERWSGVAGFASLSPLAHEWGFRDRIVREDLADKAGALQPVGEALYLDLAASSPVAHPGDLVTIDPPYRGTSGYGVALSRERVVELAQGAHERGARVLVHEAEPVIEGGPWRSLRLQRTRGKGQRTWSKQKAEWVTINFEPATAHPGAAKGRAATRREMAPISGPLFEV